jgi:GNAT superfamily N-acetyltransferase
MGEAESQHLDMARDEIRVRRIDPGAAPELERFYAALSPDSRASRFHGACRGISARQAAGFAAADHAQRDGFVALAGDRIVGHLTLEPMAGGADEVAVAVDDDVQHHGVGTLLVTGAIASARLRGIPRLVAWVKADNAPMRRLLISSSHPVHITWEGSIARCELQARPTRRGGSVQRSERRDHDGHTVAH